MEYVYFCIIIIITFDFDSVAFVAENVCSGLEDGLRDATDCSSDG